MTIALRSATLAILVLAFAPKAHADVATLTTDRDNTLYESTSGALSSGAGPTMYVGRTNQASSSRRRAVIHFDIAGAIPAGSTITGAVLTLNLSQTPTANDQSIELHPVVGDWGEGTSDAGDNGGAGAPATPGDATWRHRFFNTILWGAAGGDFSATISAATPVGGDPGPYTWGSTPAMVANIQSWLDTPAANFGWLLRGNESTISTVKKFETRESTVPAAVPSLEITYTPGGTPTQSVTWGRIRANYR